MGLLSPILRNAQGDRLTWWCPGCNEAHQVAVGPGGWTWDGNAEAPTFSPSVLVGGVVRWTAAQYADAEAKRARGEPWPEPTPRVCHSFVRGGRMEFLSDCTHALAGQTVPIPDWPKPNWKD